MKVIVCGGRNFDDRPLCKYTLDLIHAATPITCVIHGGASGADTLAGQWAADNGVPVKVYPADWKTHGRAAGPIRNALMLDTEKPDLVVALPGGRGTADMTRRAKAAGTNVLEVKHTQGA